MNRDLLSKIMIFVAGAGIGSVVTYKLVKKQYDQIIQEEIDSVKEAFSEMNGEDEDTKECEPDPENDTDEKTEPTAKETYESIVKESGYATEITKKEDKHMEKPYVISPSEFGDSDYAILTLTYFLDGTVLNERDKILKNVDEMIGEDFANHFGDYPDDPDTVYVRNDKLEIDFEILKDYREYSETV